MISEPPAHWRTLRNGLLILALLGLLPAGCGGATGEERQLDGSDEVSFQASVNALEQELDSARYDAFRRALSYLEINAHDYDTIAALHADLGGLTAADVIERANRLRQQRDASDDSGGG